MLTRALPFSLLAFAILLSPLFAFAASSPPCPFIWSKNLKTASTGADVTKLQQFFDISPATGYYGVKTAAAVSAFQEKYTSDILTPNGLSKGTGFVGAATRAKLNALCATGSTQPVVVGAVTIVASSTPALTVTASTEQPAHTIAPANALYVPFTSVAFTAGPQDVTVSQITLERVGPGSDSAFYDVGFLDPDGVEFVWGYLNAQHKMVLKKPFTIPAGTTQTYTIVGDMNVDLSGNDGQMPVLQLDAVQASAPVSGTFPIRGTSQTVNASLVIGSATAILSGDDPRGAQTKYINDTGVHFSGIRITAGSKEDIKINSINWEQTGSASASDITNVTTTVNGVSYPATLDGRYYYSEFPKGVLIKKGDSVDILVKGDFTGTGSNRTVKFDLYYAADMDIKGQTYGFGITLVPSDNTATSGNDVFLTSDGSSAGTALTPFFSGSLTTISAGTISGVSKR